MNFDFARVPTVCLSDLFHVVLLDRFMPTLMKSLRSHQVRHVVCGENHTVVLTEVRQCCKIPCISNKIVLSTLKTNQDDTFVLKE